MLEDRAKVRGRVLVVEDDPDIRSSLEDVLSMAGYDVQSAGDGRAALNTLRESVLPDVVVLDLMMPVMDGWEFRIEQRQDPLLAQIPVIALSADRTPKALAVDAAAYLPKPVNLDAFLGAVARILDTVRTERMAAADRLAALGTLAAGIAHEINNPLTYVIANLQMLRDRLFAPRDDGRPPDRALVEELLTDALQGAERIRTIVSQVQAASPSQRPEEHVPVDLRQALQTSLRMTQNELRHRARVVTSYDGAPWVFGDRTRLEQVFINLLTNAAQALDDAAPGSVREVRISLRVAGGRALVEVSDTGVGIPAEVRNRIFQPFFTTKGVGMGTGLGLSISQGIARALGGEITFESEVGKGSVFRVSFPVVPAPEETPPRSEPVPVASGRGRRILVVDDEPAIVRSLVQLLGPDDQVTGLDRASQVLDSIARGETYDVILCDLMMPEMSGMELHAELSRTRPDLANRFIFMSGGAFTPSSRRFLADGSHSYVDKPIRREALQAAITRLLER